VIVLGIETSTARSSVALLVDGELVAHEHHVDARGHGAFLAPAMRRCLDASPRDEHHVDAVAVGTGPGLYTGLRVGLATAGAFAAARGVAVVGIGGMDALAAGCGVHDRTVVTTLDARRGQLFWAVHVPRDGALVRVDGPTVGARAELEAQLTELGADGPVQLVGEAIAGIGSEAIAGVGSAVLLLHPDAADTARLALDVLATTPCDELVPAALTPAYLRDADVRIGWAERGGVRGGTPDVPVTP
jgi:tRNA threonylcarbamoyladenosine biosynthesis protein TsaB